MLLQKAAKTAKQNHAKTRQSYRFKNGLGVRYYPVGRYAQIDYADAFELNIPMEIDQLELPVFLQEVLADGRNGDISQSAWENPEIKDMEKSMTDSMVLALSYQILITFFNLQGTRDIWLTFPNTHHSLISYLKNRAFISPILMQYKVAICTCLVKGYGLEDNSKIEKVFEKCGLSRQNAIFYILFTIENREKELTFDTQDVLVLTVKDIEQEIEDFLNETSTYRLCRYHVNQKLLFIVNANRYSKDEMANELLVSTRMAYALIRPFKSKTFSANYARRAMTNTVNRIIHAYTHYDSKIRLVEGADGMSENTHRDISNLDVLSINGDSDLLKTSMLFNEDSMIDYLDRVRAVA